MVCVAASPRLLHFVPRHFDAGAGSWLHSLTVLPQTLNRYAYPPFVVPVKS